MSDLLELNNVDFREKHRVLNSFRWRRRVRRVSSGFNLAEVLISLMILSIITVYSIPKILISNQNSNFNAIAKETFGVVSEAYISYKYRNTLTATTDIADILGFMNYVKKDTTTVVDMPPNDPFVTRNCSWVSMNCYKLHNGAVLLALNPMEFAGTTNNNAVSMILDPDGVTTNKKDSVAIILYFNGMIRDWKNAKAGTTTSDGTFGPDPLNSPSWFSW